jgi:hypothetical protein
LRNFYLKAQNDPLSRSGHPNHNYAIDSSNLHNLHNLHNTNISNNSGSRSDSENNNNNNNNNQVIIKKVNGNPGISLGDGPWLDFMVAGK